MHILRVELVLKNPIRTMSRMSCYNNHGLLISSKKLLAQPYAFALRFNKFLYNSPTPKSRHVPSSMSHFLQRCYHLLARQSMTPGISLACLLFHSVREVSLFSWQHCEPWINKVSAAVVFKQNQLIFQQAVSSSSLAASLAVSTTATVAAQLSLWETRRCATSCIYMDTIGQDGAT